MARTTPSATPSATPVQREDGLRTPTRPRGTHPPAYRVFGGTPAAGGETPATPGTVGERREPGTSPWGAAVERFWLEASVTVLRAGLYECRPWWSLPARTFRHYQVWLIVGGRGTLLIGPQRFEVGAGEVLLVPPHVPHRGTHRPSDPLRCYVLECQIRAFGAAMPDALAPMPLSLRPAAECWPALLDGAAQICQEITDGGPGHALVVNGVMAQLLGRLWREAGTQHRLHDSGGATGEGDPRLAGVFTYIGLHFGERLTLAQLARVVHLSPAHFSTTFRRAVGLSPFQYLQRYRLQRARRLLSESQASVAEVAAATGFSDPSYFARAFKRAEGVSPRQYRLAKESPVLP
jgi:AraC-like DNA-binding protein/mannose-6-phosphate isomerase-like protein (cupin superfamily)